MDAIGYVRVSTDEQVDTGAGLAAQRAAITAAATQRGWTMVDVIEDAGFSGKNQKRPGLMLALEAMKRGDASVLVVSNVDRLSRSLLDFAGIMDMAEREGWACVALDAPMDSTNPAGEAMVAMMAVFAQLERRLISQRTKKAMGALSAQGKHMGRRSRVPQSVADWITEQRENKIPYATIAKALNDEEIPTGQGGKQWYASTVRDVYVSSRGEVAPPLEPEPVSEQAQQYLIER